jgi:leader peptidase (prepilin peptidase)/N-methyltransferase
MAFALPAFDVRSWRPSVPRVLIVLAAACAAAASFILAPAASGALGAAFALLMGAVAFVDAQSYTIPDKLTAAGFALALLQAAMQGGDAIATAVALAALRGAVLAALFWSLRIVYRWLRGRDGLGLGDVKLAGVAGAWLGWTMIPIAVEIAALSAIAFYAVRQYALGRTVRSNGRLPFGAFFAPAIWLAWVFEIVMLNKI